MKIEPAQTSQYHCPETETLCSKCESHCEAAQPVQPDFSDAYQGAREDAEIWKKRALEAEELNRKFIADINGHTFMGEPAQPVQPNQDPCQNCQPGTICKKPSCGRLKQAQPVQPAACQYCNGTGDVHGIDGEWRGECKECKPAGAQGDADDSLLLCASDLEHSAIYDNHAEMQDCIRAVALRIKALGKQAPAVAINEQLLQALKAALKLFGHKCFDSDSLQWSMQSTTAIRAAEAEKAKWGV